MLCWVFAATLGLTLGYPLEIPLNWILPDEGLDA
jgi:hypothetical protein